MKTVWVLLLLLPLRLMGQCNFELSGDIFQVLLPFSAVGFSIMEKDGPGIRQAALTLGSTTASVYMLKKVVESRRPNGRYQSFPSGHTAVAFASAGFMQRRYGWKFALPFVGTACLVGISRVDARAHWLGDVVAGAAIGWLASRIFTRPICSRIYFCPLVTSDTALLSCSCDF